MPTSGERLFALEKAVERCEARLRKLDGDVDGNGGPGMKSRIDMFNHRLDVLTTTIREVKHEIKGKGIGHSKGVLVLATTIAGAIYGVIEIIKHLTLHQ